MSMKKCTICNETKELEYFSRGQNKCKRCRSKTKEPEIPATDCNYLITIGKNAGQWCNENIIEHNKCKKQSEVYDVIVIVILKCYIIFK